MILIVGGSHQGKYKYGSSHFDEKNIWDGFHDFIKSELSKGKSNEEIKEEVENKLESNPSLVIISNEIGCGIVPFTEEDRNYRELTGRLLCEIAEKSEAVFKVTCGIAQRIK